MTQAAGAFAQVTYVEEVTWGTTPGTPAMKLLKAMTPGFTLRPSYDLVNSNALNSKRSIETGRAGDIGVAGAVPFELALLGLAPILKHAIGPATSGRAVTQGAGLTGLTAQQAESTCSTGAGTLSLSGSNATWAANGDTAGAAVDVSVEGYYTLESSAADHAITVYSAGSPSGTSATVTVSSTAYAHIITRGALPVGLSIEAGWTDISEYEIYTGCRVNGMSLTVPDSGICTGSLDVIGKTASGMASSSVDASPTISTHTPIMEHEAAFEEGGSAATLVNFVMNLVNNLEAVRAIGSRTLHSLREGKGDLSGVATFLFESNALPDKIRNATASSLKCTWTVSGGSVEIYLPNVVYRGAGAPGIETAQGILLPMEYQAYEDDVEDTDIKVTITNTESSI